MTYRIPIKGTKYVHGNMFGIVLSRARKGDLAWVNMRWKTWRRSWTTRHYLPDTMLDPRHQREWTEREVRDSAPRTLLELLK